MTLEQLLSVDAVVVLIVIAAFCLLIWSLLRVGHDCHLELQSNFEEIERRNGK